MPTAAQNEAYWRDKLKGQTLSTSHPDTVAGAVYDAIEGGLRHLNRWLGAPAGSEDRIAHNQAESINAGLEGVIGAQAAQRAGRNIQQGRGSIGDALDLTMVPGLDALALKYVARPVAKAAAHVAAPVIRHIPEVIADAGRAVKNAVFGSRVPEGATPRGQPYAPGPAPQLNPREEAAGVQQHVPVPTFQKVHPGSPYLTKTEGPFLHVKREGAQPLTVPEARGADLDTLRGIVADPSLNQPAQIADAYARENLGHGYDVNFPDPGTSLRKQSAIGRAFQMANEQDPAYKHALFEQYGLRMPDVVEASKAQNYDQLTEAAYRKLAQETSRQFGALPVELKYHYGEGEYGKPSEMLGDLYGNSRLNVFRGGDKHPYLSDIDPDTGLTANEQFRAVHDYFGHGTRGTTFRPGGEETAYASHSQMMSPLAQMALLPETRGQNSVVNYSPLNADLRYNVARIQAQIDELRLGDQVRGQRGASNAEILPLNAQLSELGAQTKFAPQTPLLLPPEYLSPMTEGGMPDWLQAISKPNYPTSPERAVHLSHTPGLTATDPSWYGTGHRGDDWPIRGKAGSPENKTSFYLGDLGTVNPEPWVRDIAPHAYQTQLSGLYDIAQDPERLVTLARAYNVGKIPRRDRVAHYIPDLRRMIREYGYNGVRNPNFMGSQGAADVFDPVGGLQSIVKGPNGYADGGLAG